MLKLRRIELNGFKSFSDRCELAVSDSGVDYTHADLQGQIWINSGEDLPNGIVPPNGIVDGTPVNCAVILYVPIRAGMRYTPRPSVTASNVFPELSCVA